jgi:holin-like protein
MPFAFAILVGFQLAGEVLRQALHLPLPGPLIGMFLLAVAIVVHAHGKEDGTIDASLPPPPLATVANSLITHMGLLFVPAGVGVILELGVLREEWLPILAGLVISTVLGLAVTGLVMHHVTRVVEAKRQKLPRIAHQHEAR